jgi:hypothetical protein
MTISCLDPFRSNFQERKYSTVQELVEDLLLIYSNCELYNDEVSDLHKEAKRQKKKVLAFIKNELKLR